ncbi:MAG: hypothetical protein H6634_05905 [Anaerolineales bacterium]|nr:hypothetical protein [Anaerolineales bacterium]MCB9110763.1 hypothetical protein [Anaerolineales bacterium]
MTYCAGWKYRDSVCLIADTAITKFDKPSLDYSSFGQLHSDTKDGYVQEALLKLIPISEGIAIGYAGDVQIASEIIELLKDNVAYAESAKDLVRFADNMGPFSTSQGVALLIASSNANGNTELIKWDTINGVDLTSADFYEIGSLNTSHSLNDILRIVTSKGISQNQMLVMASSIFQSYGIHEDLIQKNIGGTIFGLATTQGKISWQEDTNYVLYSNINNSISLISTLSRDNAIIVNSSITNDVRVFYHTISTDEAVVLDPNWRQQLKKHYETDRFRYWIFISIQNRVITLLIRRDLDNKSKYVRFNRLREGEFDMELSSELLTRLRQPLTDKKDGSIPFRLNVLFD